MPAESSIPVPDASEVELEKWERGHPWDDLDHPRQKAFLVAFVELGVAKYAAEAAGIHSRTVRWWRSKDEKFAEAFAEAKDLAADEMMFCARERALKGYKPEVLSKDGVPVPVLQYDNKLLMFMLRYLRPDVFNQGVVQSEPVRHQHVHDHKHQVDIDVREGALQRIRDLRARRQATAAPELPVVDVEVVEESGGD